MGRKKKEKKGRKKTKCGFLRSFPKVAFLKIERRHKKTTIHRIQRQDANDETGEVSPKVKQRNGDDRIEKRDDVFGDYFRCALRKLEYACISIQILMCVSHHNLQPL